MRGLRLPAGGFRTAAALGWALAVLVLATGCRHAVGEALPATQRSGAFCVEPGPENDRRLSGPIAESFRASGVDAVYADVDGCTGEFAYVVTYLDEWAWDIRKFLFRVTIEVTDASSGEIVAYGESTQDSTGALGTSHRDVIDRAVAIILAREADG